jgi:hypothetical protein
MTGLLDPAIAAADPRTLPAVSCFVLPGPAGGSGESLESVRGQRWPADRLDVVALRGPLPFALERALAETTGELIAFIVPGDVWLPEKLRLQVAALAARPEAGAVHSDVQPVGADGAPVRASWFAAAKLDAATGLGGVLAGRHPWASTLVLRRELAEQLLPLPAAAEAFDAYVAARVAAVAELAFVPVPLARVPSPKANGGACGADSPGRRNPIPGLDDVRRDIKGLRWALGALPLDGMAPDELAAVRAHLDGLVARAAMLAGAYRDSAITVAQVHRVAWRRAMARAGAARALGRPAAAAAAYLAAGAADPFERHAREQLDAVLEWLR